MSSPRRNHPLLSVRDATVVVGGRRVLDRLSIEIAEGQHTAILGPNGSGKTSFLRLISCQYYPLARGGEPVVSVFGRDLWNVSELHSILGIVSPEARNGFAPHEATTGLDAVISGFFGSQALFRHHRVTPTMREKAGDALRLMGADHLADRRLGEMSTGERRRVLIARALAPNPRALLLDEPSAGLDVAAERRFLETLRRVAQNGTTAVLVTHHVGEILPEIDHVVLMKAGTVHRAGPKRDVLTSANLSELFDVPVVVRRQAGYYSASISDEERR